MAATNPADRWRPQHAAGVGRVTPVAITAPQPFASLRPAAVRGEG